MAKLNPESVWEFADAIKSIVKPQTTRRKATVQNIDKDGTIWVNLPGSSTVTPIQSTGANVSPGDMVLTELRGTSLHITENQTNPAIGENTARSIAKQETQHAEAMAKQAKTIADEANAVAQATNQHFWDDANGAHITDVTQDEWKDAVADNFSDYDPTTKPYHNQLLNSLGILLRTALNNLVSITRSAIAFYDGTGNAASNIVARFGSNGAQIGLADESHMELDYNSLQLIDKDGDTYLYVSDLRQQDGTVLDTYTGNGSTRRFDLSYTATDTSYTVKVDGVVATAFDPKRTTYFTLATAPANGATITAQYDTENPEMLKVYTLGKRTSEWALRKKGRCSVCEGVEVAACGDMSHAEGYRAWALGECAHAEGSRTEAYGDNSHAQNLGTDASSDNQTAMGRYNVSDANDTYALIIGNGTADNARSNAFAVKWDGTVETATPVPVSSGGTGLSNFGSVENTNGSNVSVPTGTWKQLASFNLAAGKWLVIVGCWSENNSTGRRGWTLTTSTAANASLARMSGKLVAATNGALYENIVHYVYPSADITYYVHGYQTSGGALDMSAYIRAVRIG